MPNQPKTIPELDDFAGTPDATTYVAVHKDGQPEAQRMPLNELPKTTGAAFFQRYLLNSTQAGGVFIRNDFKTNTICMVAVCPDNGDVPPVQFYYLNTGTSANCYTQDKTTGSLDMSVCYSAGLTIGNIVMVWGTVD